MRAPFWIELATAIVVGAAVVLRFVVQPYVSGRVLQSRAERLWDVLQADSTAKLSVEVDELKLCIERIRRKPRDAVTTFLQAPPARYDSAAEPYHQRLMAAMDEYVTDTSRPSVRMQARECLKGVGYQHVPRRHISLARSRRVREHV